MATAKRHPRGAPIKHYLLTVQIASNARMHCYLMTDDERQAHAAADRLLTEAEKTGSDYPLLSVVLMTSLSTGVELVREIISARSAEVKRLLQTATDFHVSMWMMGDDDPDDARLMALH